MDFFKHKAGWVGNRRGEKFAGCFVKQRSWHDNLLWRTNQGFGNQYSCKDVNYIWSKRHKKCIDLKNCEQRNEERTGCVKCNHGHELQCITKPAKAINISQSTISEEINCSEIGCATSKLVSQRPNACLAATSKFIRTLLALVSQ
jgi:hypothetical protein